MHTFTLIRANACADVRKRAHAITRIHAHMRAHVHTYACTRAYTQMMGPLAASYPPNDVANRVVTPTRGAWVSLPEWLRGWT